LRPDSKAREKPVPWHGGGPEEGHGGFNSSGWKNQDGGTEVNAGENSWPFAIGRKEGSSDYRGSRRRLKLVVEHFNREAKQEQKPRFTPQGERLPDRKLSKDLFFLLPLKEENLEKVRSNKSRHQRPKNSRPGVRRIIQKKRSKETHKLERLNVWHKVRAVSDETNAAIGDTEHPTSEKLSGKDERKKSGVVGARTGEG